jgi:hypothetical protein
MFAGSSIRELFKAKRRTRAINFRLSEEEFRELKRACAAGGARSVSDFARAAVCRMVVGGIEAGPAAGTEIIDRRLDQLQQQLNELVGLIREAGPCGSAQTEPEGSRLRKQTAG